MRGPLRLLFEGLRHVARRVRAAAEARAADDAWKLDQPLLSESLVTLREMLQEIDKLARDLPADARPIGEAARILVQKSIDECSKPVVDGRRLAEDMQQVGKLALAMRERLLLSPWRRDPGLHN